MSAQYKCVVISIHDVLRGQEDIKDRDYEQL